MQTHTIYTPPVRHKAKKKSHIPNAETLAAMREAERIANDPHVKGFWDVDALFEDLEK